MTCELFDAMNWLVLLGMLAGEAAAGQWCQGCGLHFSDIKHTLSGINPLFLVFVWVLKNKSGKLLVL